VTDEPSAGRRNRRSVLATQAAILIVCALVATAWAVVNPTPEYWAMRDIVSDDPEVREAALETLLEIGTARGAPALLDSIVRFDLDTDPPPEAFSCPEHVREYYATWAGRCLDVLEEFDDSSLAVFASRLRAKNPRERVWAVYFVGCGGRDSERYVPTLEVLLSDADERVRFGAARALAQLSWLDPDRVRSLAARLPLNDLAEDLRESIAATLCSVVGCCMSSDINDHELALLPSSEVSRLVTQTGLDRSILRERAMLSEEIALRALTDALTSSSSKIRAFALQYLTIVVDLEDRSVTEGILAAVDLALESSDPAVLLAAVRALDDLVWHAQNPDELVAQSAQLLAHDDVEVRRAVAQFLSMAENPCPAAELLVNGLSDPDVEVRNDCAYALGDPDALCIDAMIGVLATSDGDARRAVIYQLSQLGQKAKRAFLPLLALLDEPLEEPDYWLGQALGCTASTSEEVERLLPFLESPSAAARAAAAAGLAYSSHLSGGHGARLRRLLDDESGVVRARAAQALCYHRGGDEDELRTALSRQAKGDDTLDARREALRSLVGRFFDHDEAVQLVVVSLDDEETNIAVTAAKCLERLDEHTSRTVPRLVARLERAVRAITARPRDATWTEYGTVNPDRDVARAVLMTLLKLGPKAAAATASLERVRDRFDGDTILGDLARRALSRVAPGSR